MQQLIQQHLQRISTQHGVRILYACETGSRGWGFASPDSDFDVRFIFVHPVQKYLSVLKPADNITAILEDGGEVLDFNAWELRKLLGLLSNANASPFEWLQSSIVYQQVPGFRDELWHLAKDYFEPRASIHHYLGICHNSMKTGISDGTIKIKKYFYILRPLLAAMWAADRDTVPPMAFEPLLSQIEDRTDLMAAIRLLWAEKEKALEGQTVALIPVIQTFIETETARCQSIASTLPTARHKDLEPLSVFFRNYLSD